MPPTTTASVDPFLTQTVRLRDIGLAAVAEICVSGTVASPGPEDQFLNKIARSFQAGGRSLLQAVDECTRVPAPEDVHLVALVSYLRLSRLELLAVALAAAVEDNPVIGRVLAHVQSPLGGSRPTLGLLSQALTVLASNASVLHDLLNGPAVKTGLLGVLNENTPLPERPVMVSTPLCLAIAGHDSDWPGTTIGVDEATEVPLSDSVLAEATRHAAALSAKANRTLVLRTGSPAEGRSAALAIASALDRRPAFIDTDKIAGLVPWLLLRRLLPVFCLELAPADRWRLPPLPGYQGPVVVVCGPDGSVNTSQGTAANWHLPVPSQSERRALWLLAFGEHNTSGLENGNGSLSVVESNREAVALAEQLASDHRHGAGRIAHLGRLAHHHAMLAGHCIPERIDVKAASWTGEAGGLDALAEPLLTDVPEEALVASPKLRAKLEALMLRCRVREHLVDGLGASARTRYRPGVRALFIGPSGTGKTLSAGWIAARLGFPLYRVDLASVTSKYIGETEKNLSQLLARAEQAEVILLFDEADSLFGKRTDINDSNDRFANAQTNYLLQRIENYDGIVLLSSNSQGRFDEAFARRLDFVVEFPPPSPEERRALWISHLGLQTTLHPAELNQLAALLDLSGGHIRNVVLTAAVRATRDRRHINFEDLLVGVEAEFGKLGRQVPLDLQFRH